MYQALNRLSTHRLLFRNGSNLTLLRSPKSDFEVYLLGTAHVSERSEQEVRGVIGAVRPAAVMVELCQARADHLRSSAGAGRRASNAGDAPKFKDPLLQQAADLIAELAFASGKDMAAAMEEADAIGARVICGDIPQNETLMALQRAVATFPGGGLGMMSRIARAPPPPRHLEAVLQKLQPILSGGIHTSSVRDAIEALKDRKALGDLNAWLSDVSPELMGVILQRRDHHMFENLNAMAEASLALKGTELRTVAVVGVAHMDGIENKWVNKHGTSTIQSIKSIA
mmetsp:Transcript_62237/g.140750  ORF Transcript_62237/g.140750 Transcript_62237/m.140750 type:complete len:284 (-) Transcript_62237:116-967(-)